MSNVSKQKIEMAKEALVRANWFLRVNAYDALARKEARKELAKAETLIKAARESMRVIKKEEADSVPQAQPVKVSEHDDDNHNDNGESEADHEDE